MVFTVDDCRTSPLTPKNASTAVEAPTTPCWELLPEDQEEAEKHLDHEYDDGVAEACAERRARAALRLSELEDDPISFSYNRLATVVLRRI